MKMLLALLTGIVSTFNIYGQTKFQNDKYGFGGQVPVDWHVYTEVFDNPSSKSAILDWGLPKVYSELEKRQIENAVSITAYKRPDIMSVDDLMKFEFKRLGAILTTKELLDSIPYYSFNVVTVRNGMKYKSQAIFRFENSIGYVINFTATPGTYDLNIQKFSKFVKDIQLFVPKEIEKNNTGKIDVHYDGIYVAKTDEMTFSGNKMGIFTYIRFYSDGTVCTQAVNSYDPQKVSKWFGKNGKFERKGGYNILGSDLTFIVNNSASADVNLEGPKADKFSGILTDANKLFLEIKYASGDFKSFWFEFVKLD